MKDCDCKEYHDADISYQQHKYIVGNVVEYKGKLGVILWLSHYPDGTPCYALEEVDDKESSCTAAEGECVLYEERPNDR